MKSSKIIAVLLCMVLLLGVASCHQKAELNDLDTAETNTPDRAEKEPSPYVEIIEKYCELVRLKKQNGAIFAEDNPWETQTEISETVYAIVEKCENVSDMGYATKDINGDDVLELVLMNRQNKLYALFTLRDNVPVLLLKMGIVAAITPEGTVYSTHSQKNEYSYTHVKNIIDGNLVGLQYGYEATTKGNVYYKIESGVRSEITKEEKNKLSSNIENIMLAFDFHTKQTGFRFVSALGEDHAQQDTEVADFSSYEKLLAMYKKTVKLAAGYTRNKWVNGEFDNAYVFSDDQSYDTFTRIFYSVSLKYPKRVFFGSEPADGGENFYGYALKDLNTDGIQELVFLTDSFEILAIFTQKEGVPVLLDNYTGLKTCQFGEDGILRIEWYSDDLMQVSALMYSITSELELRKDLHIKWDGYCWVSVDQWGQITELEKEEGSRLYNLWLGESENFGASLYNKSFSGLTFQPLFEAASPMTVKYTYSPVGDMGTAVWQEADGYGFSMEYYESDPKDFSLIYEKDISAVAKYKDGVYLFDNGSETGRLEFGFHNLWVIIESSNDPNVTCGAYFFEYYEAEE